MNGIVEVVLIIILVAYVLLRRLLGEPVEVRRMLVLPAVVTLIGLLDLAKIAQSVISTTLLLLVALLSAGIGVLRGGSVRVAERGGIAVASYTWVTLVLWVVSLVVKFGSNLVLGVIDPAAVAASSSGVLLTLGVGLLAEGAVVIVKALRTEHPIVWSTGRSGRLGRSAPLSRAGSVWDVGARGGMVGSRRQRRRR